MAIIKCSLTKDGSPAPLTVEFEPGDKIQFQSKHAIRFGSDNSGDANSNASGPRPVLTSFGLGELSADAKEGQIFITISRADYPWGPPTGPHMGPAKGSPNRGQ
jgi:hypothetical protein